VAEKTQTEKYEDLAKDVQSLKFDNERIIKPALKDIRDILSRDVYASKVEVADLKKQIEALELALEKEKERTRNYQLVERVVFGLVGVILLAVVGALVGLVVIGRNSSGGA